MVMKYFYLFYDIIPLLYDFNIFSMVEVEHDQIFVFRRVLHYAPDHTQSSRVYSIFHFISLYVPFFQEYFIFLFYENRNIY